MGGGRPGLGAQGIYSLLIGGVSHVATVVDRDGTAWWTSAARPTTVLVEEQTRWIIRTHGGAAGKRRGQTLVAAASG